MVLGSTCACTFIRTATAKSTLRTKRVARSSARSRSTVPPKREALEKLWNRAMSLKPEPAAAEPRRLNIAEQFLDVIGTVPDLPEDMVPADLERFVQAKVRSGRFASSDEAIAAAVRLLRQQEEAEEARVLEGISQGLEDMRAGRGRPAEEVFAEIRREFDLPPDA